MMLIEMTEALKERGFEEVPTSKLPANSIELYDIEKNIIYFTGWHRYFKETGNLEGTSLYLNVMKNHIEHASIVLPDAIQDMYWNNVKKLEKVLHIPYDYYYYGKNGSNYAYSCSDKYKELFFAFKTLLDNFGIIPEKIYGHSDTYKPFRLDLFILEELDPKKNIDNDFRLGLIPKNENIDLEFYMNYLDKLPEKIERLKEVEGEWTKLVGRTCESGKNIKEFYEDLGIKWRMPIRIDQVISDLYDIEKHFPEQNPEFYAFARSIAERLGCVNQSSGGLEPGILDGKINPEGFYRVAEEALYSMVIPTDTPALHSAYSTVDDLIKIATHVGGIDYYMGVQFAKNY